MTTQIVTLKDVTEAVAVVFQHPAAGGSVKRALLDGLKALKKTEWEEAMRNFGGAHSTARISSRSVPELAEAVIAAWSNGVAYAVGVARQEVAIGRTKNAVRILTIVEDLSPYGSDAKEQAGIALAQAKQATADLGYKTIEMDALALLKEDRDDPTPALRLVYEKWLGSALGSGLRKSLAALHGKLLGFATKRAAQHIDDNRLELAYQVLRDSLGFTAAHAEMAAKIKPLVAQLEGRDPGLKQRYEGRQDDGIPQLEELPEELPGEPGEPSDEG